MASRNGGHTNTARGQDQVDAVRNALYALPPELVLMIAVRALTHVQVNACLCGKASCLSPKLEAVLSSAREYEDHCRRHRAAAQRDGGGNAG